MTSLIVLTVAAILLVYFGMGDRVLEVRIVRPQPAAMLLPSGYPDTRREAAGHCHADGLTDSFTDPDDARSAHPHTDLAPADAKRHTVVDAVSASFTHTDAAAHREGGRRQDPGPIGDT